MKTTTEIETVREYVRQARTSGQRIGLVPTMGALHQGHLSLVEQARQQTDFVIVTIFVNPTQFAPEEDLEKYPRPLEEDLKACRNAKVDLVFHPEVETMYAENASTFVEVEGLSSIWEGAFRPTHFRGVTTVVAKLFQITLPDVAFFGRKDYQQLLVIKKMTRDLLMPIEIVGCETIRETDGLAMSSRNQYLNQEERQLALKGVSVPETGSAGDSAGGHRFEQGARFDEQFTQAGWNHQS